MRFTVLQSATQTLKRTFNTLTATVLAVSALAPLVLSGTAAAAPQAVYNAVPSVSPSTNYPSWGFEATSTSEFGDYIHLSTSKGLLDGVTVTMSNWAKYSDYSSNPSFNASNSTWSWPITLNIYSKKTVAGKPVPDVKIATVTKTVSIPWRPESDPTCADTSNGKGWKVDTTCYNFSGIAFNAVFNKTDFAPANQGMNLPKDLIMSVAYNTQHHGYAPTGTSTPANSLNVAIPNNQPVTAGTDDSNDRVFVNSTWSGAYDGGATGTFRQSGDWAPNGTVAFRVNAEVDNTGPQLNLTPSPFASAYQSGPNVSLTATDDLSGVASSSIKVTRLGFNVKTCNSAPATPGSVNCDLSTLSNGDYKLVASSVDKAGNASSETHNFTIDSTKPTVNIANPDNNEWVDGSFNVNGTAFDLFGSGVKQVDYTVVNSSAATVASGTASGTTFWNFNVNGLSEGDYTITVTAIDNAGNSRQDSVTVHVDTTKPDITFTNPADFSKPFMVGPNFSILTSDNSGSGILGSAVEVYNTDGSLAKFCWPTLSNTASCDASALDEGEYYVTGSAIDRVGNYNSVSKDFVIDKTAPVVTVNSQTSTTGLPTLSGTVNDSTATVTVSVNGHSYVAAVSGNSWSAQVTNLLSNGTYDVVATATDQASNSSTDSTTNELTVAVPVALSNTNTTITVSSIVSRAGTNNGGNNNGGNSSTNTGEVLGTSTTIPSNASENGEVKGATTEDEKGSENSGKFLGLGWWWLLILAALGLLWWLLAWLRRRSEENEV